MSVSENVKRIRQMRQIKQMELAKRLGISQNHLSQIENGKRNISIELLEKIASEFGLPASDLLEERRPTENCNDEASDDNTRADNANAMPDQVFVKIYAQGACAGVGVDAEGYTPPTLRTIPLNRYDVGRGDSDKIYGIEIEGRSMEPKIFDGDVVIVNENDPPGKMDVCYAKYLLKGFWHSVVKFYVPMPDGGLELRSTNDEAYPPIAFTHQEINDGYVEVLGTVKCKVSVERL